jgi:DNA ligase-1
LEITGFSGEGSVEKKITRLAGLLASLDQLSNRFVARIPVGRLRLGFSDMTVLDALSFMLKRDKSARTEIETAFNVRPDLGFIARTLKEKGLAGLLKIKPQVFTPILMARAERLSSGKEIIDKIGICAVEPKVDGFRLQAHFKKNGKAKTVLFTRNLEDATFMYPDVVAGIEKQVRAKEAIFEGEAIAYNPDTGEFLPFQETVQRKRKYGIKEKALELPLRFICFDVLFVDGRSFVSSPYEKRREALEKLIGKGDTLLVVEKKIASEAHEIENEFDYAVARGLEGIVAKRLDGVYQAGARGWNWIKFKRSYSARLSDTIDAVVMGYYKGQGKRTSFGIGAFLIGVYDEKSDQYVTVAKIGTGLTDEEWRELHRRAEKIKTSKKPALYNVDKLLFPDVWVEPSIVVEIKADEITRSPVHTAGRVLKPSKTGEGQVVDVPGFALRFPRLERFRDDKRPEDVTTLSEIEEMEKKQK